MKYKVVLLLFLLISLGISAQELNRTFPYHASLQGTSAPTRIVEKIKTGAPTGSNRYTEDGLRLTYDDTQHALSGFYLKDVEVPMNYVLTIDFEYATLDGETYNDSYGDGLTMFFFDSAATFDLGSTGSGIGYAYNNASGNKQPGLDGAYLGLSLDVFGDAKIRANSTRVKREGVAGVNYQYYGSHVTLRGGQHENNRYKGYPVIYSQQTYSGSSSSPDAAYVQLDFETGDYIEKSYVNSTPNLRTQYGSQMRFNKVTFEFDPVNNGDEEFALSYHIDNEYTYGGGNYGILKYKESFKTRDENGNLYTFNAKNIDSYRIGFAASTGEASQTHLLKNINVRLKHAPETQDKEMLLCLSEPGIGDDRESWIRLEKPFEGARFYVGDPYDPFRPKGGDSYKEIDFYSLRLEDEYGYPLDYRIVEHDLNDYISQIYDEPGVGEWELYYNTYSCIVYFTPEDESFPEGDYSIYISAKSIDQGEHFPFSHEDFRSRPTKITVKARYCKSVVNPSMPIRVREESDD
ncbi:MULTISPECIES: hypothetical protein [unclassified Myroides]|uniref:hypothetical protein n=1 Tax=unclassified Myroides TaxID=2642485 RepID=UPI003D2F70C0